MPERANSLACAFFAGTLAAAALPCVNTMASAGAECLENPDLRTTQPGRWTYHTDRTQNRRCWNFEPAEPGQRIRAVPGEGQRVPLYILGSSLFGAQLAAMLGLPFAFAAHFAPDALMEALDIYRSRFEPSAQLDRPHAMVGVNIVAADSDDEAARLFTSIQQSFVRLRRGAPGR